MDTDEYVINNFANVLRNYHVQRTVSLYSENRSRGNSGEETYEDVISGVAKQLKAIQNADSFKKHPSGKGIPNFVKKSTFLPVHMVPIENPSKEIQSHKFETQCVLDTQLMDIIDNAEAIMDAEKGITQEFDTTFYHKDNENCKDKAVDCEIFNTSQKTSNVLKSNDNVDDEDDEFQKPLDYHSDRDETNHQLDDCIMSDNETVKHLADKEMTQEFDTTFCPKELDEYIKQKNDCHANQENDVNNIQEKNINIQAENCREKESVCERKSIADITVREIVLKTDKYGKSIDLCDDFDTQLKLCLDRCEDDNDSQSKELTDNPISKEEEPSSPILNKIRPKVKSNTPSPLIFELESFEKFETLALPVIENHDFETAKRVINSQILNRELFIHTHAEAVLSDRDKGIQKSSPIQNRNIKSESLNVLCTDSQLHLKEDSMLFSSDEENDVQKKLKVLPLTCTIQTIQDSCNNDPDILDKNMYVGFQTASNKSIQISTDSYCKAKSIFDNFVNIEEENLSEMNVEALATLATKNINELDKVNIHNATNNNADDIAYVKSDNCATCNISQNHSNVFEHMVNICTNEDKLIKQQISKANTDVQLLSTSEAKYESKFDSNFMEHLKIDYHVLEEFDKDILNNKNKIDNEIEFDLSVIKPINNDFEGFRTANNKMIKISSEAQMKTKKIFENINSDDNLLRKCEKQSFETPYPLHRSNSEKNINNLNKNNKILGEKPLYPVLNTESNAFQGFTTASNKPVKISETALAKTINILNDIDIENNVEENVFKIPTFVANSVFQGFKTAKNRSIPITTKQLAKSKELFQVIFDTKELSAEFSNFKNESLALINDSSTEKPRVQMQAFQMASNKCNLGSFKTAANKPVGISAEALAKSKNIFQDIDNKESHFFKYDSDIILKEKQPYPIAHTSHNAARCHGFKTTGNKPVGISAEALAKSKKIFQDIDKKERNTVIDFDNILKEKQPYPIAHTSHNAAICHGFKTAANKPVGISAEALAKSNKIFQGIHNEESNIVNDSDKIFKGQQVETSGDALVKSKKIFEHMNNDCKKKEKYEEVVEKQPEIVKKSQNFAGFNTASNKKVTVSENALIKSRQVLQKSDFDMKNDNHCFKYPINKPVCKFGFQTGNNTDINISEEALRKSKNLFSDLDESIEANLGPKLKEIDDVISENDILEDFNTEIIKDFEETVYTEDFIKNETPKSKRSGSPILSCPKSKKRKKFETPVITKKFIAPIKRQSIIKTDTTNVYSFNENYKKHKNFNLKDVNDIEKLCKTKTIDPYILNLQFEKLLDFEFINDRNDIDNDKWTTDKIKGYFTDSVNKQIIPNGWIDIHLKMIIWKLVSYEIRFPGVLKNVCSVKNVLEQLKYRYKRELYNVERPVLRKILEKDEVSSKMMILCVAGLFVDGVSICSVAKQTQNIELLLTDGWYTIKATTDRMIDRLVCEGKISVGTKLVIHGAELMNCEQGIAPWEDTSSIRLKISGNSTRRVKWDARLGLHVNGAILSRLSAVKPEGGRVSQLRTLVTRVYPTLYIEKFPDGSTLTRSERLEHIYQMQYETERQIQMENLYEELEKFSDQESQDSEEQCTEDRAMESGSQISRLMKKSSDRDEFRANLTSSQAYLLQQHALKQKDKLVQALQDKFLELVKKRGLDTPRNVVPLMKIRVADVETGGITRAMVTIWKPNENLQEMLTEGTWIDLYNVVPTSVRYNEIQISAGRQSVFRRSKLKESHKLNTLANTLRRQCYTAKDLQNPSMNADYNEVDTVGLIFMIEPRTVEFETSNQPFQNVYLTDADKNIICVNFWGGIKKFGFQNILDTGQVVTCVNLQKRAGNTRKSIPQYRATEFTYFTKTPKNDSVRKLADDLAVKFCSLDKRKFIDDCVALKNNYHNFKCGNTENVSPYRLNTSDYNVYKNKGFIDSPLVNKCTDVNYNLTGLDFESTFKQTDTQDLSPQLLLRKRKVNEKIAKLKMYGEPPPLSPIHMINKSSNTVKAFKSPLTRNDISTNVASPSTLPQNREENKSIKDNCHQNNEESKDGLTDVLPQKSEYKSSVTSTDAFPQNRIDKIDSSPVLSLNRTYVKRSSINPVKLNFSNAIETSITDPFAEDFDGSPPLSLDVDFVT